MKHNLKYLASYLPWLLVLLAFDLFTAVLLWLSDVRMFQALILLYILATVLLFFILSFLLIRKERKKAFTRVGTKTLLQRFRSLPTHLLAST